MYKRSLFIIAMIGAQLTGCKTSESTITMQHVRNYDPAASDHILFLDFKLTQKAGKPEVVELVNVVSGSGRLKNLVAPVHSPYQISVVPSYPVDHLEVPVNYPHPLHKSVEVASEDGKLSKQDLNAKEGVLSVRIQKDKGLEKLELFSLTPEKGKTRIYTLNIQ